MKIFSLPSVSSRPNLQNLNREEAGTLERPSGWRYRDFKIGPVRIPWYASPPTQVVIVAFVFFLCPGMFNALTGMGGGGQQDHHAANDANTALFSTFAVIGFFAGTLTNIFGIKTTFCFGGLGYSVYVASFLCYSHTQNYGFTVFAGALLGLCAALLWTVQGAVIMSYPPEKSKAKYISWFWIIFNLGAFVGSLIPLGQNIRVQESKTVGDGTYIGFLVLTVLGSVLSWTLVDAKSVVRQDGSRVILMKNPTWRTEVLGLYETLRTDSYIVFLFPMFFVSDWYYAYIFNDVNGVKFNTRTRALNNTLYYAMQIVGAFLFGYALDRAWIRRTIRARIVWAVLLALTMVIWGFSYAFQKNYTRMEVTAENYQTLDWKDSSYIGPMFLYMFYGFFDAAWQISVYWIVSLLTNNGRKLANFSGFYKGIQSAGAAIIWRLDGVNTPYMNILASCWALLGASLFMALPVVLLKIKDHITLEEDLKFTDETFQDIALGVLPDKENQKEHVGIVERN